MREDPRAFVDRPISDLDAARSLASTAATEWNLDEPALLRRGMNAIFSAGNAVLRVSSPNASAAASIELAERLTDEGLRVTRPLRLDVVEAGELAVTCWERFEPTSQAIDWEEVGSMIRRVHRLDEAVIPPDYPLPAPTQFPWWDFESLIADVGDALDDPARSGLLAAIERWPAWRDLGDVVVCHGDVHPGNVIMSASGPVLIDWDLLCLAPVGWDHAPMMTWEHRWGGQPGEYEQLAHGYGESLRGDQHAEAFAELRLVAATLMRFKAAMTNETAMAEAQRRLAYWRGDRNPPMWQAQ